MTSFNSSFVVGSLFLIVLLALSTGCPQTITPKDGGGEQVVTPDVATAEKTSPLTCSEGALCMHVGNDQVRACDILLKNDKDFTQPEIGFNANTSGQFKFLGTRLALSFLTQKDEPFGKTNAIVAIKTAGGIHKLDLAKVTCFDVLGKKVEKPEISIVRP